MATEKKYASLDNLRYYDTKLKQWVTTKDEAIKAELQGNIDKANQAVKDEETRAKASEVTNAAAAQAAQASADKAQGDVDSLKKYVGTIPTESSAEDVIAYVKEKTSGIATDTALNELQGNVDNIKTDVDAIKADYLKASDKTDLTNQIAQVNEKTTTNAEAIAAIKEDVDAFFADADMSENAKDTLKELQEYIASDESGAAAMAASIKQNTDAISALETSTGTKLDAETASREEADTKLSDRITSLETAVGASGSVASDIAKAKDEAIATASADATAKANTALSNAKTYTDEEVAKDRIRIDALETDSSTHALASDVTVLTGRVDAAEKEIDQLQIDMDANEALAAANEAAIKALQTASSTYALKKDLDAEIERAKAAEKENADAIAAFVALDQTEIDAFFA